MTDVSIGIVTHNSGRWILNLLSGIFKYTEGVTFEVHVVDNFSKDDTARIVKENFPQVHLLAEQENLGFGRGHDRLLSVRSRYHLICNPDIELRSNVIKELTDFMDAHPECAMVTPKVLDGRGREQFLPKRRPTAKYMLLGRLARYVPAFQKYRDAYTMKDRVFDGPAPIEFCTGCFMFLRTEVWKKVGGFDERFFMYLEDADLSDRVRPFGEIVFYPFASVVHNWERGDAKSLRLLLIHFRSMFKYLAKKRRRRTAERSLKKEKGRKIP